MDGDERPFSAHGHLVESHAQLHSTPGIPIATSRTSVCQYNKHNDIQYKNHII
jgi:hypothetical protein